MTLDIASSEHLRKQPAPQLLNPEQFKAQFFDDLRQSHKYVLIKSFMWRNDGFGRDVAKEILAAAERGIRVIILKDQLGALYEFAEPNGLSFFHDNIEDHLIHFIYGKLLAAFYNQKVERHTSNPLRQALSRHHNIQIIEGAFHDHSKIMAIDGRVAYVAGLNFGDEHLKSSQAWHDFAIRLEGKDQCLRLMKGQAGLPLDQKGGNVQFHHGVGESLSGDLAQFILGTRKELLVFMAYLGDPVFTDALVDILRHEKQVKLIVPTKPSVNSGNNLKALHHLVKGAQHHLENLEIVLSPDMGHGKALRRDGRETWIGSKNFTTIKNLGDTVAIVNDPKVAATFDRAAASIQSANSESITGQELTRRFSDMPLSGHIYSGLEDLGTNFFELTHRFDTAQVDRARLQSRSIIRNILQTSH